MNNKKEIISYLIFGVLTTSINILVYFFLVNIANLDFKLATSIAWLISVLFAFFTNKKYVFNSQKKVVKELILFFGARLFSYVIDLGGMIVLIDVFNINDNIAKVLVNVLVIILNYFISKLFVFK
ncbi:teichoic acid glycosylation protein [Paenibacillus sp. CFBP13512]|uniref:GtrA family protein n=1 Tax=Paenibacillus sp. CFBP13512 TaxID=2184007 RepID=UPI0010BFF196|nr:GtrA family protein [Paenibacillus sp. CFBP13512]TKJ83046.1 teichoic acid glycosylation protein [Paenibacillus sp. CFBP13512]